MQPSPARPLVVQVEDDATSRVAFEQSFGHDFEVVAVADAPRALALLETRDVAVLLTDLHVPGLAGEELLRLARRRHPRTMRVVVTAYADVDRILRAINDGLAARYVVKPWLDAELAQVLRWACETRLVSDRAEGLHRRLAETDQLAGDVRRWLHDLRTPLMTMLANAEHLEALAENAPALHEAVSRGDLRAGHRRELHSILDDLLPIAQDVATATADLGEMIERLHPWPDTMSGMAAAVDPLAIVRHAISVCQPLAAELRASIDYRGPDTLPEVSTRASDLTQVMIHLLADGVHAGAVSIDGHARDDTVELVVRDSRVGIVADAVGRGGTTVIGVAECRRLVDVAGGTLQIEDDRDAGTMVTIALPVAGAAD